MGCLPGANKRRPERFLNLTKSSDEETMPEEGALVTSGLRDGDMQRSE